MVSHAEVLAHFGYTEADIDSATEDFDDSTKGTAKHALSW
jgi:hypothetical protein